MHDKLRYKLIDSSYILSLFLLRSRLCDMSLRRALATFIQTTVHFVYLIKSLNFLLQHSWFWLFLVLPGTSFFLIFFFPQEKLFSSICRSFFFIERASNAHSVEDSSFIKRNKERIIELVDDSTRYFALSQYKL